MAGKPKKDNTNKTTETVLVTVQKEALSLIKDRAEKVGKTHNAYMADIASAPHPEELIQEAVELLNNIKNTFGDPAQSQECLKETQLFVQKFLISQSQ